MLDHSKWRFHRKKEGGGMDAHALLFPRICEKMRDDPVRLIEVAPPVKERTCAENNMILLPQIKEASKTTSLFVERRRYAR